MRLYQSYNISEETNLDKSNEDISYKLRDYTLVDFCNEREF